MVKPRLFLFVFVLWISTFQNSSAQFVDDIKKSLSTKPQFFLNLASFNTFIDGDFASFDGIRTGLIYDKKVRFGVGYFALANNGVVTSIEITEDSNSFVTNGQLELHYFNLTAEYYFYHEYPWQFSVVPFNLALGSAHYEYISRASSKRVKGPSEFVILYQPEITGQFNVVKWFGFGISTGYRIPIVRSKQQTRNLGGIVFSVDFRLSLDQLYYELRDSK